MRELIERVRSRLASNSYVSEAAVSHGIVTPILNALGWDSSDPAQMVPEFSSGKGRVDFALFGLGRGPSVFVEVKGVGRAVDGDRQLFEYAFHEGVPLCVLTDGREWSFYLPSGQGSYEDRRVYRLQLDDRDPAECQSVLVRYLARERVRNGSAFEAARTDHRDAAKTREAAEALPRAWDELVSEPEDLLLDLVAERAEALCGFRPLPKDVVGFLKRLGGGIDANKLHKPLKTSKLGSTPPGQGSSLSSTPAQSAAVLEPISQSREVRYKLYGKDHTVSNAKNALVTILEVLAARDPNKLPQLAKAVGGRSRSHIAQSIKEIYPKRPDLASAAEFYPGWFVGLNIANREKMRILRVACGIYGMSLPGDLEISLPNAT